MRYKVKPELSWKVKKLLIQKYFDNNLTIEDVATKLEITIDQLKRLIKEHRIDYIDDRKKLDMFLAYNFDPDVNLFYNELVREKFPKKEILEKLIQFTNNQMEERFVSLIRV
jgi:hypothetical protein